MIKNEPSLLSISIFILSSILFFIFSYVLDKDDFLISKWLLDRNEDLFTEYQGHSHGGDTTGDGNHRHQIKFNIQDKLEVNDKVILLRIDDKFIILDKVVSI